MWSFNPVVYLNHAWEKTNTGYGKTSLVLFYVYVWIAILKCLYGVFDPTMMGAMNCFLGDDGSTFVDDMMMTMMRGMYLFGLSFFVYVDKGGLHSWNVGFVTVVTLVWVWIAKTSFLDVMDDTMYNECVGSMGGFWWISVVWVVAAFALVVVDENQAPTGTEEETQPINPTKA